MCRPKFWNGSGIEFYNEKNYEAAEKYLTALGKIDNLANVKPDFWFYFGDAASKQKDFGEAEEAFEKYLHDSDRSGGKSKSVAGAWRGKDRRA